MTKSFTSKILPDVEGILTPNAALAKSSWFGVGGPAEFMFIPKDENDLKKFLKSLNPKIPIFTLGALSNVLIRDGGVAGVVIKLGSNFNDIISFNSTIKTGASAMDMNISKFAAKKGIGGMEFLSGIPGSIGGSVKMNAGAFGHEISDILKRVKFVNRSGEVEEIDGNDIRMGYRKSFFPKGSIILEVQLKGYPLPKNLILNKMKDIKDKRLNSQPVKNLTGGSTFKNPKGFKAWELIDKAGCRGLIIGGAEISQTHPNFIINKGNALSADIESLGLEVKRRVKEYCGIDLKWEIQRVGKKEKKRLK